MNSVQFRGDKNIRLKTEGILFLFLFLTRDTYLFIQNYSKYCQKRRIHIRQTYCWHSRNALL